MTNFSTAAKIEEAANMIGIHEPSLMWIAEVAATVALPPTWQSLVDDEGKTAYYQPQLKLLQGTHPGMEKFKAMHEKQWKFFQKMSEKMAGFQGLHEKQEASCVLLLNEVMNRINKELPPNTPELTEKFALLFNIDTTKEFKMTAHLAEQIDLFAEQHFDAFTRVGVMADPRYFIQTIRKFQVQEDVTTKPDPIVMCSEYEDRPAVFKCEQCKDFFSKEGFAQTHLTGKRKSHKTQPVVQQVCSVYNNKPASCSVDGVLFSDQAYAAKAAEDPDFRLQHKKLLEGLLCSEFPNLEAEVLCEQCVDLFSWQGFIKLHRKGQRRHHCPLILTETGQLNRHGFVLPRDESYKLVDKARLAKNAGPWLAFKDDWMTSYWFNFCEKTITHKSPYI